MTPDRREMVCISPTDPLRGFTFLFVIYSMSDVEYKFILTSNSIAEAG